MSRFASKISPNTWPEGLGATYDLGDFRDRPGAKLDRYRARIKIVPHQRPVRVREPGPGWSAGSGQRRPDREPILRKAPSIYRNLPSPTIKITVKNFVGGRAKSTKSRHLPRSPLANHCESEESWRAGNPAPRPEPNKKRSPHRVRNAPQKRKEKQKKTPIHYPRGGRGGFRSEIQSKRVNELKKRAPPRWHF